MNDVISIALGGGAFVVAVAALYVGSVKRADIEMILLSNRPFTMFSQQHREEGPPVWGDIRVPLAVINSGARPGVLTGLDVERTRESFFEIERSAPEPNFRDGALGALPLVSGESQIVILVVTVSFPDEAVEGWRCGLFRTFDLGLSYSFLRGRKVQPTSIRKLTVPVAVDDIIWKS